MSKGLLFFICSCIILVLSAINLSVGPIVNKKVGLSDSTLKSGWGTLNCEYFQDHYEDMISSQSGKDLKYKEGRYKEECLRKKGMYNMEYTSFIFNICIGFSCGLIALLHLMEAKKDFVPKTGLIGLICGVVGFVLSFVYVVYNGIVYTKYYDYDNKVYKKDSEGAFAVLNGDKYICFYHDEPANEHSIIAKYSDLIKKQYNYDKDLIASYGSPKVTACKQNPKVCLGGKEIPVLTGNPDPSNLCEYLYVSASPIATFSNKDLSDRFLTTLILSLIVCLANIGLAIFGILLFKNPEDDKLSKFETVQSKI